MASEQQIIKLMAVLSLAYPNYQIKDGQTELYYQMLKDLDYELLDAAAKSLMTTAKFYPSIAELRQTAFDLTEKAQGIPDAFTAWEEVMYKIGHKMTYDEPEWSHPLIARAVQTVGFKRLCNFNLDDLSFERSNFYKVYDSLLSRARDDVRMLPEVKAIAERLSGIKQLASKLGSNHE